MTDEQPDAYDEVPDEDAREAYAEEVRDRDPEPRDDDGSKSRVERAVEKARQAKRKYQAKRRTRKKRKEMESRARGVRGDPEPARERAKRAGRRVAAKARDASVRAEEYERSGRDRGGRRPEGRPMERDNMFAREPERESRGDLAELGMGFGESRADDGSWGSGFSGDSDMRELGMFGGPPEDDDFDDARELGMFSGTGESEGWGLTVGFTGADDGDDWLSLGSGEGGWL